MRTIIAPYSGDYGRRKHAWPHWMVILVVALVVCFSPLPANAETFFPVGVFSMQPAGGPLPQGWEALGFQKIERRTRYWLEAVDGVVVMRAASRAAASGLQRHLTLDLQEWPLLRWRWRVESPVSGENMSRKSGDDFAARIYVNFPFEPDRAGFWARQMQALGTRRYGSAPPGSALTYVWSSREKKGASTPNPFTDKVMMLVVRGEADRPGQWFTETRDVAADYRALFGEAPPPIMGVAIMCDTDNTGSSARASFGDIVFLKRTQ